MAKLNQVIAIEKGVKNQSNVEITAAYHDIQKPALFAGIARSYEPKDEDGEKLPPENQKVQKKSRDLLNFTADTMTKYWDITATKDVNNCHATADVVVDGQTLIAKAPVTFLLFLEKQLGDLTTMVRKLPVLDPGETWKLDPAQNAYATEPTQTVRTKKIPKSFVAVAATKEHPAQAQVFHEDVTAGYWRTVKFSGAMPQKEVDALLDRIGKVQRAVKFAREEANGIDVKDVHVGKPVFAYLLG